MGQSASSEQVERAAPRRGINNSLSYGHVLPEDLFDTGASIDDAVNALLERMGHNAYVFEGKAYLEYHETTRDTYETNVVEKTSILRGTPKRRLIVNYLYDPAQRMYYYRAWFGALE